MSENKGKILQILGAVVDVQFDSKNVPAIYQALENDPNNSELLNLLRWTQDQELALIEQVYSPQWQTI